MGRPGPPGPPGPAGSPAFPPNSPQGVLYSLQPPTDKGGECPPKGRTLGKQTRREPGSGLGARLLQVAQKDPREADTRPPTQLLVPAWPIPAPVLSLCSWGPDPPQVALVSGRPQFPHLVTGAGAHLLANPLN